MEKRETEGTYWATKAHLNEQQSLLEGREAAQVHGRETTDGHSTDAIEEAVDIVDMELAIGGVEYSGEYERCERAVLSGVSGTDACGASQDQMDYVCRVCETLDVSPDVTVY